MTALIRGELIKTVSTRTLLGYAVTGVALAIANVVIVTQFSGELVTVSDKQEAIAGLPIIVLLFGLVGATGEYRHRTAAPAALVAGRDRALLLLARASAYALTWHWCSACRCWAVTVGRASARPTSPSWWAAA